MRHKARNALIATCVVAVIAWLVWNRETTEWFDTVPDRFIGKWILVQDLYDDGDGIRSIIISAKTIVLHKAFDDGEQQVTDSFPVRKVSLTSTPGSDAGSMVILYEQPTGDTTEEGRWEIRFGTKQELVVQEIVPTGWGEDHWIDVGEFVKAD
jgi:hypothetical protein